MSFSSLTLTRNDIDSFEGQTFQDVYVTPGSSQLNISEFDDQTVTRAKQEMETDILEKTTDFLNDDSYDTQTALLDDLESVDDENLLINLWAYKFLELWFTQDATHEDSLAWQKANLYSRKYQHFLHINIKRLCGLLDSPKNAPRLKMKSTYA